jgi:SAM-dependent MidA family methyltransferase
MQLEALLSKMIKLDGPMRLDRFMALVSNAYYEKAHIFGENGDFITAPKVSKYFAYAISNWLYSIWQRNTKPKLQLFELGPGDGSLMHDLIEANNRYDGLNDSITTITLIEKSKTLIAIQSERLKAIKDKLSWQEFILSNKGEFSIIIANEFFDALPIRQLLKEDESWNEIYVNHDNQHGFYFIKAPSSCAQSAIPDSSIIEISPLAANIMLEINQILRECGGAALLIDYGYNKLPLISTLQAIKNHRHHPLLSELGNADWTAHVNFAELSSIAINAGLKAHLHSQKDFLVRYNITTLMKRYPHSFARLTDDKQMGLLFKVLEVCYDLYL